MSGSGRGRARIAAVVLAAGESSRFGGNKLLARLGESTVVRAAVERAAAEVDEVVVVLGRDPDQVRRAVGDARFVVNERYREGMGASIRTGIEALAADTDAALIVLGDQPVLPPDAIPALIARYRRDRPPAVVPVYRGTPANPVLFDRSLFGRLGALEGDRGARSLVEALGEDVAAVELDHDVPTDVDTPDDLRRVADG